MVDVSQPDDEQRLLADDLAHIVWVGSADGVTHYLNRYGREFLGLAAEEAHDLAWLRRVHPDDVDLLKSTWKEGTRSREAYAVEYRLQRADGEYRWFVERGTPHRGADGEILKWVGTCTEITARKAAEEALAREKGFSDTLLASLPGMVYVVDRKGRLVRWNRDYEVIVGRAGDDLAGSDALQPIVDEDRPVLAEKIGDVLRRGGHHEAEGRIRNAQGDVRDYLFSGQRVEIGGEQYVVGTGLDITDRRRAEEQQARLSRVVEQSAESIVITDPQGSIIYVNPAFEAVSGYSREEVLGQNPRILKSGEQDPAFYRGMWETLAAGGVWSGRLVNRRKDGTLFHEDATIGPVRDASGRLVNFVAVKRDVTNETRLERQLLQAQKMEAVGRLAGGVAHDFNNLLGVIMGYADMVQRKLPVGDPLRGKVEEILKAADRAANLTRQLLAFSRQQVLQPRVLDLNIVVSDVEKMLRRVIGEDVELKTKTQPDLGTVKADPGQIEQVLVNLAVNARDAMPEGGVLTIETQNVELDPFPARHPFAAAGRYVMLAVSDTGAGMTADVQAHVFEPFFTTKEMGKGTGLGLSTVYGIVKQSEGYIWLYSEVGVGTTFKVYLPRVDAAAAPAAERRATELRQGTETVLVVEDEPALREVLCETLAANGYAVLPARDGAEALQIADEYSGVIHLIVTDMIMPGMTGRKAVEQIAPARPEAKILFVSGYTDDTVARLDDPLPGSAFLSKPFSSDDLLRKIREVLDGR